MLLYIELQPLEVITYRKTRHHEKMIYMYNFILNNLGDSYLKFILKKWYMQSSQGIIDCHENCNIINFLIHLILSDIYKILIP